MDPITFVRTWLSVRPFKRLHERRLARKALEDGSRVVPAETVTEHAPEHVEAVIATAAAIKGAASSKLIWLGVAQLAYSLFELWINGTLSPETAAPAVTGLLTIVFRAMTGNTLAEKGS
jgi:hypothetical protein